MDELTAWMKSGDYLPEPLRDFHDQKDVFKLIHEVTDTSKNDIAAKVDWVAAQVYVIDVFLWFMARRGYTLQRSRKRLLFRELDADVRAANERRDQHVSALLSLSGDDPKERT